MYMTMEAKREVQELNRNGWDAFVTFGANDLPVKVTHLRPGNWTAMVIVFKADGTKERF